MSDGTLIVHANVPVHFCRQRTAKLADSRTCKQVKARLRLSREPIEVCAGGRPTASDARQQRRLLRPSGLSLANCCTGLGFEAAKQLAEHGFTVLLGCRNHTLGNSAAAELALLEHRGKVIPVLLDVTSDASVNHACQVVEQKFGKLDVLVSLIPYTSDLSPFIWALA